jgi:dihydrofolate reductase
MRKVIVDAEVSLDGVMGADYGDFWKLISQFHINSMPKYVASRTLKEPLEWNATLINGDVAEAIRKLKQEPGNSLLQYGVGELTHTMLKHGLVDELRILVYPFTFGGGSRIFEQMSVNTLKLLDTKTFSSGVVALYYQPQPST